MKKNPVKKEKPIETSAVYCKKCGTVLFSRATHDYRSCHCGGVAIDGGFDYCKINFKNENDMVFFCIILPKELTVKVLYNDWNLSKDLYGFYKVGEWPLFIQEGLLKKTDEDRGIK